MLRESQTVSVVKGKVTTIDHDATDNAPKIGDLKKAPSPLKKNTDAGPSQAQVNWKKFSTVFKTVGLCIKHLVNFKEASRILTNQRLDRRDQAFCTANHHTPEVISNAAALKRFADPKLDTRVMSGQLGKLMEPHMRGVSFDLAGFKKSVNEHFPNKVTSHALSTVDVSMLEHLKQGFIAEGRKEKADALQVIIDAYKHPSTKEGAREFFFDQAKELVSKGDAGKFLRVDGDSAPIVGFLKPNGLDAIVPQLKHNLEKLQTNMLVTDLGNMLSTPRDKTGEGKVETFQPITNIINEGFTKDEAAQLIMVTDKVLDAIISVTPDKELTSAIKEITAEIQKRVGEGKGKITQDEANKMIRLVYVNALILRTANPIVFNLDNGDKAMMVVSQLVQLIANGQANSDNTSKINSPEVIEQLKQSGDAMLRKLEKFFVEKAKMPEACAIKTSKPETMGDEEFLETEEFWEVVDFEVTEETTDPKGKGEDK